MDILDSTLWKQSIRNIYNRNQCLYHPLQDKRNS